MVDRERRCLWLISVVLCFWAERGVAQGEIIFFDGRQLTAGEGKVYSDLRERVFEAEFAVEALLGMLSAIEESSLPRHAKTSLRGEIPEHMRDAEQSFLRLLLVSGQNDLQALALGTLRRGRLSSESAAVLGALVIDPRTAETSRVEAMLLLRESKWRNQWLPEALLRQLIASTSDSLAWAAAFTLVHPECELLERERAPDPTFEARVVAWLQDEEVELRRATANCLLFWGAELWLEDDHPLVTRAVEAVAPAYLDHSRSPEERGWGLWRLHDWLENRRMRQLVGELLQEENWFSGRLGPHGERVHSLEVLLLGLAEASNRTWAKAELRKLLENEASIRGLDVGGAILQKVHEVLGQETP